MTRHPLAAKDVKCRVLYMPISHNSESNQEKDRKVDIPCTPTQLNPLLRGLSTRPFKSIQCQKVYNSHHWFMECHYALWYHKHAPSVIL